MKRFIFPMLFILALLFFACGVSDKNVAQDEQAAAETEISEIEKEDDAAQLSATPAAVANPMVSYNTLEEINEIVGSRLCSPAVMGVSDKAYFVVDIGGCKMAEERFVVAGFKYDFRCAPVADRDISGLWTGEGKTAFSDKSISDELQYVETAAWKAARWFTIDGQYVLSVADDGKMAKETFLSIADEMRDGTRPGMSDGELAAFYANLAGNYWDATSLRATAEVTANGSDGVTIFVRWSSSAFESMEWKMEARRTEDGLISYPFEERRLYVADSGDAMNPTVVDTEQVPGWFVLSEDGKLLWTGANEEQCRKCVFEK